MRPAALDAARGAGAARTERRSPVARRARRARKKHRSFAQWVVRAFALLALAAVAGTAGAVALLRYVNPPVTAMMMQQPVPLRAQAHVWVGREAIAVAAAHAVIASEDQRFLLHSGFDFASIERAVAAHRAGAPLRGASTITQQVAKNLFLWPGRSFVRKGIEAYFTLLIETLWPKERILEVYLNVAELGTGVFGVEAAAQRYFSIGAAELDMAQAALLAAVLPNPKQLHADRPSEYVAGRQAWILGQMRALRADGHFQRLEW
jgi:monofunctional glycosyltransferase